MKNSNQQPTRMLSYHLQLLYIENIKKNLKYWYTRVKLIASNFLQEQNGGTHKNALL